MSQIALNILVADYIDTGREGKLFSLEQNAKKGLPRRERLQIMIAFARARVAHPEFGRRSGLRKAFLMPHFKPNQE